MQKLYDIIKNYNQFTIYKGKIRGKEFTDLDKEAVWSLQEMKNNSNCYVKSFFKPRLTAFNEKISFKLYGNYDFELQNSERIINQTNDINKKNTWVSICLDDYLFYLLECKTVCDFSYSKIDYTDRECRLSFFNDGTFTNSYFFDIDRSYRKNDDFYCIVDFKRMGKMNSKQQNRLIMYLNNWLNGSNYPLGNRTVYIKINQHDKLFIGLYDLDNDCVINEFDYEKHFNSRNLQGDIDRVKMFISYFPLRMAG